MQRWRKDGVRLYGFMLSAVDRQRQDGSVFSHGPGENDLSRLMLLRTTVENHPRRLNSFAVHGIRRMPLGRLVTWPQSTEMGNGPPPGRASQPRRSSLKMTV